MKRLLYYALPLTGHVFCGTVNEMSQLSAMFQIFCRNFGMDDTESLNLWQAGKKYDDSAENIKRARVSARKLPKSLKSQPWELK